MADSNSQDTVANLNLFPDYRCPTDRYDELLQKPAMRRNLPQSDPQNSDRQLVNDGPPVVREHYHSLMNGPAYSAKGIANASDIQQRWQNSKRSLRENPSASTGQLSRTDASRLWELDPIPFVISDADWEKLSQGIEQRVRILDSVLQDVYSEQKLVERGILPPEVVYGSTSFIRSMRNSLPKNQGVESSLLHIYACQIIRNPQGNWQVVADRTQGPSGFGLAVENRLAISRVLEREFRHMNVRRLAGFFASLREHLKSCASTTNQGPSINVLLSPGVASQTYFEDAYLARYLGYTLTNVSDLTVRGGDVYLKTLGGLVGVDAILRRIPDTDCDPLEININGSSGVSGLCQAIRDKQVFVANQLGTGWAEAPVVTALLPKIAKEYFGEELVLDNTDLHWCGDPIKLEMVLDDLEKYSFRNAFTRHSSSDWTMHRSSPQEQSKFRELLMSKPWSVVAVEPPKPSYAPTWINERLVAAPAVLRIFASRSRQGFEVMPGGMARVAEREDKLSESLISGTMSKDVWVLSKHKVPAVSLLAGAGAGFMSAGNTNPGTITEMRRNVMDLPSRIAEHLYWLGRSTERAEGMARHARLCVSQLAGTVEPEMLEFCWQVVHALSGDDGPMPELPLIDEVNPVEEMRKEVFQFLYSPQRPVSLSNAFYGIRFNSEVIRDRLSYDSWQLLNKFDLDYLMPWVDRRDRLSDAGVFLNQTTMLLTAFAGVISENMTRGPGWLFLELGRRIERAYGLTRLIELLLVPGGRPMSGLAESLLEICDSSMTYRYRYLTNYEVAPTLDLILFDPANPRSVAFQLVKITELLDGLTAAGKVDVTLMRREMLDTRALLRLYDAQSLAEATRAEKGKRPRRMHLEELLTKINVDLNKLGDFLSQRFLNHTVAVRHLEDAANQ